MADDSWTNAADVHSIAAGEQTLGDWATGWLTKGVPLMAASGITSVLNTGIKLGNLFGSDSKEIDLEKELKSYDDDLMKYYREHKEGVDLGGFIATSFVPGTLALKGLKAMEAWKAGTGIGKNVGTIVGFFGAKQEEYLKAAAKTLNDPTQQLFGIINRDKVIGMAAGLGEQVLHAAAIETGILLTMNQNPVMEPQDRDNYAQAVLGHLPQAGLNALIFGGAGGLIGAATITGKVNRLIEAEDARQFSNLYVYRPGDLRLPAGSLVAHDFRVLKDMQDTLAEMKEVMQGGGADMSQIVTEKAIINQQETVNRFQTEFKLWVKQKLVGDTSVELSDEILKAIDKVTATTENGMRVETDELVARAFGGATKARLLGPIDKLIEMYKDFETFHGSPVEIPGGFKNDVRGSVYNIFGPGAYQTTAPEIMQAYANRQGAIKPTAYGAKEVPGKNIPLYDLAQPITPEMQALVRSIDPSFAAFGELDKAKSLMEFYLTASRKSFGLGEMPPSAVSDGFNTMKEHFEALGFRGFTHEGGILGGRKHTVKIHWFPEEDLIIKKIPQGAKFESYVTHFSPNLNERIVKLSGDEAGTYKQMVYPIPGDEGKIVFRDDSIYVTGSSGKSVKKEIDLHYDPQVKTPTDSSYQFLYQRLTKPLEEGDKIPYTNLPMLEKAYLEGMQGKVKIEGYPGFADDPLEVILRTAKKDVMSDMIDVGFDKDYIARAINVPKEFLENSDRGGITLVGIEDHMIPLHAKLTYRGAKDMNAFVADAIRRNEEQMQVAMNARRNAGAALLERDWVNLPKATGRIVGVGSQSPAAGLFTSADAARGSTGMIAMFVGKMVDKISKTFATDWQNVLHPIRQEILNDPAKLYLRNINAGKLRASDETMLRLPAEMHPGGVEDNLVIVPESWINKALEHAENADPVEWIQNAMRDAPTFVIQEPITSAEARYLIARQAITGKLAEKWNLANAARGSDKSTNPLGFYEPPMDTTRLSHFALVRDASPLNDLRPHSVIVAQSAEDLAQKVAKAKSAYGESIQIFLKDDIKNNKLLLGEFESNLFFGKSAIDSGMKRAGVLSDYIPRKDGYIFEEENQWLWKQAQGITRQGVELTYGQEFAQLRFLERGWNKSASTWSGSNPDAAKNPYTQMINTYLNLGNKAAYSAVLGKMNEGMQAAWNAMTDVWNENSQKAAAGKLSFAEAEAIAQKAGYSAPFGKVAEEIFAESWKDTQSLSKLVTKVNMGVSTLMVRMDALNSLVNGMSLPVLLAAESSNARREIAKKLGLYVQVPGTPHEIPSTMRLLMDGTQSFWKKEVSPYGGQVVEKNAQGQMITRNKTFKDWLYEINVLRTDAQQFQDAIEIPLAAVKDSRAAIQYVDNLTSKIGEFGTKYTGNNWAEDFVRYQAAHAGLKIGRAMGITDKGEMAAFINLTVNRMHGNYLASQRPTIFSGTIGHAISLFQTYQFNMIQQMTRLLQEGDYKSIALALGMQNALFGLQSNPMFWQLNKYIGESNRTHGDIVTGTASIIGSGTSDQPTAFGHSVTTDPAKWLLYGLGANVLQVNLYNRGDLTPRYPTVLPTNPMDIPAVSIISKTVGSFLDTMKNLANGAPVADSILQGVAHSGFNRPLAGISTLISGKKTTGSGSLLAAYNDIDGFTVAAKIAGGEPLNNALAIDSYYRIQQYSTHEAKRMQDLGEAAKLTFQGKLMDASKTQDFMNRYAAAGGDQKNFNRFMIRAELNADTSVVQQMRKAQGSPLVQRQLAWLGADLPENLPPTPETQEPESSTP